MSAIAPWENFAKSFVFGTRPLENRTLNCNNWTWKCTLQLCARTTTILCPEYCQFSLFGKSATLWIWHPEIRIQRLRLSLYFVQYGPCITFWTRNLHLMLHAWAAVIEQSARKECFFIKKQQRPSGSFAIPSKSLYRIKTITCFYVILAW